MPNHPRNPDIDLLSGHFYAGDVEPHYDWLRAHAPVYFDAKNDVWALSTYEHVTFASQDELDQRCVGGSHLIRRPLHSFASPRARFTDRTPGARASPTRRPARPRPKTFKR